MTPTLLAEAMFGAAFVSQLLAFILLAILVVKFGVPVIKKMLGEREQKVRTEFETLERETREATAKIAEMKAKLASIDEESKKRIQAAIDEGTRSRTQALAEANALAAVELAKAKRDIQFEREKAILELRAEIARLTLEATEKTVDGVLNESVHGQMVDKTIEGLEKASKP